MDTVSNEMDKNIIDFQYKRLIKDILNFGDERPPEKERTGTGTYSIFTPKLYIDLDEGFPLITTKKTNFDAVVKELLWFISGSTNVNDLDSKIWNEWADSDGNLGPIYGKQWNDWDGYNQLADLQNNLINNPYSRRHILTAWNVGQLNQMKLAPCHILSQFYVDDEDGLHSQVYQRSADVFLGLPFNIASYALLMMMYAKVCNLDPVGMAYVLGDAHIYQNHYNQAMEVSNKQSYKLPTVKINGNQKTIFDFKFEDFELVNYQSGPFVFAPVAI